jgi:hypothetical protein
MDRQRFRQSISVLRRRPVEPAASVPGDLVQAKVVRPEHVPRQRALGERRARCSSRLFRRMPQILENGRAKLDEWTAVIRKGGVPNFGANLRFYTALGWEPFATIDPWISLSLRFEPLVLKIEAPGVLPSVKEIKLPRVDIQKQEAPPERIDERMPFDTSAMRAYRYRRWQTCLRCHCGSADRINSWKHSFTWARRPSHNLGRTSTTRSTQAEE